MKNQLFFELLHEARELKRRKVGPATREMFLLGMRAGQENEKLRRKETEINQSDYGNLDAVADRGES